jgi:hypothetical protein
MGAGEGAFFLSPSSASSLYKRREFRRAGSAVIVAQDWRKIHVRIAGGLVASTVFGIPVGLMLLTGVHQQVVKAASAIVIIVFSAYSLAGREVPELLSENRIWLVGCGFCTGVAVRFARRSYRASPIKPEPKIPIRIQLNLAFVFISRHLETGHFLQVFRIPSTFYLDL